MSTYQPVNVQSIGNNDHIRTINGVPQEEKVLKNSQGVVQQVFREQNLNYGNRSESQQLRDGVEKLILEVNRLDKVIIEKDNELKSSLRDNDVLYSENQTLAQKVRELSLSVNKDNSQQLQQQINQLRDQVSQQESQANQYRRLYEGLQGDSYKITELQQTNSQLIRQKDELQRQYDDVMMKLVLQQTEIDRLKQSGILEKPKQAVQQYTTTIVESNNDAKLIIPQQTLNESEVFNKVSAQTYQQAPITTNSTYSGYNSQAYKTQAYKPAANVTTSYKVDSGNSNTYTSYNNVSSSKYTSNYQAASNTQQYTSQSNQGGDDYIPLPKELTQSQQQYQN